MGHAIWATGLCKEFSRERGPVRTLTWLRRKFSGKNDGKGRFVALRDVNFAVRPGEKVALIGNNGAGKTTLLKTVAGLYKPTRGQVHIEGRVILIAGLGLGMVDALSVRENVFLYGAIHGLERSVIADQYDEILEWAELPRFAEAPLKTLSTGMQSRLAFATMRHIDADVYLFDEALTAGDKRFNQKCMDFFMRDTPHTFLIATHTLQMASTVCSRALWLDRGQVKAFGAVAEVVAAYQQCSS
jgi:ABC-type polysaccharide/polyol phosphate transport system ATPase subunit